MKTLTLTLALIAALGATAVEAAAPATAPAGHAAMAGAGTLPFKGKVVSTIDASQYTYIEVQQDAKTVWLAAPAISLKKGNMIRFEDGAEMTNFHSKTLNRTFASVKFVNRVELAK